MRRKHKQQGRFVLTPHARNRLKDLFGLDSLPDKPYSYIEAQSNSKRVYRIDDIYFVYSKNAKKVITVMTEERYDNVKKNYELGLRGYELT